MATYLIAKYDTDYELWRNTLVEGKHIQAAIETYGLEDGEAVEVYRIAGPARQVTAVTEQITKLEIT